MADFRLPADELEYTVLAELWQLGKASVRELHQRVGVPQGLVYTTTAKVLDRLRSKALIERSREATGYVYTPAVEPATVERARARHLLHRFLGPGPHAAAAALVEAAGDIDPALLDEFEQAIRDRRKSGDGS